MLYILKKKISPAIVHLSNFRFGNDSSVDASSKGIAPSSGEQYGKFGQGWVFGDSEK